MVDLLPATYRDTDDAAGGGVLVGTMEAVIPSMDGIRRKIRRFDELRDPLKVQSEATVVVPLVVLKVESNGDGTAKVFLSEGADNDKFDKLRLGYTLVDALLRRFEVVRLCLSIEADEIDDPPTDPATGLPTGSHVVVNTLSLSNQEVFPFVSGTFVVNENPTPVPVDDGVTKGPYIFTVANPPVASNRTALRWSEGAVAREGFFTINFEPGGDLGVGSTINSTTGEIILQTKGGVVVDADTIRIDYTTDLFPVNPEDAEIRSQNLLAFLAADYAIALERSDPDNLQRSWVNSAFNLWDLKGTDDGYQFLAKIAGFTVSVDGLYRVADGFSLTLPTPNVFELPGGSGNFYSNLDPFRPRLDDLPLDDLPLDVFCAEHDVDFPSVVQAVTIDSVTNIGFFGSEERYIVVASTATMEDSYGVSASIVDFNSKRFEVLEYERIDDTSFQFLVQNLVEPALGAATVTWSVFKRDLVFMGLGFDIEDLGTQALGFTGKRFRLTVSLDVEDPITVGPWAFIDNDGVVFRVEAVAGLTPTVFQFEVVGEQAPVPGSARLFYNCDIITTCNYCRASALQFRISLGEIINSPESLADNPVDRVINRMQQMIPRHVRLTSFIFSPGPAIAEYGFIAASGTVTQIFPAQALYSAYYDEDEFPADEIPTDSGPIVATSEVTITSENVFEEYITGSDPIIAGIWSATGLWHILEYRSSTEFRAFQYGTNDVGRFGEIGSVAPDYVPGSSGILSSPIITGIGAGSATVTLRFRQYGDTRPTGAGDDLCEVRVIEEGGSTTVVSFDKTSLGFEVTGTTDAPARGTIRVEAAANYTDGQTFEYDDGVNPPVTYEIDANGGGVGANSIPVDISGDVTAPDVLVTLIAAMNTSVSVSATGVLTLVTNILDTQTVVLGSRTYTFETAFSDTADFVLIGASASDTIDNFVAAIVNGAGEGSVYGTGTVANAEATAAAGTGDTMDATATAQGSAGNGVVTTELLTGGTWSAATLGGGVDGDLDITATSSGYDLALLENDATGAAGNTSVVLGGAPPGVFSDMTGGGIGFVTVSKNIDAVKGVGDFHLEFDFDSVNAQAGAEEGWYIDDVEVQVTP